MAGLNDAHSLLVSVIRGGRGWFATRTPGARPDEPLIMYEFEA